MATLGLGIILSSLFVNLPVTDGFDGFRKIPFLWLGGEGFAKGTLGLSPKMNSYIITWAAVFIALVLSENIINSRAGRALKSIHDSEAAAMSLGINVGKFKNIIFTLSSFYAAVAGCLFAHTKRFIAPSDFNIAYSITFVTMVVVGGARSIYGAIAGAAVLTSLTYVLQEAERRLNSAFSIHVNLTDYHIVIYGLIIVLVMIFVPEGIAGGTRRAFDGLKKRLFRRNVSLAGHS
jgi:branched-chain amino acid transport system permease protein